MNTTVIDKKADETQANPSLLDEVLFFSKATVAMGAIIYLVSSAWI